VASPAVSSPREPPPTVGRPYRALSSQIDPATMTPLLAHAKPPPQSPGTGTATENRRGTSSAVGFSRLRPVRPLPRQTTQRRQPSPLSSAWARAHGVRPCHLLPSWAAWAHSAAAPCARARLGQNLPSTQPTENPFSFSFSPFSFPIFIYKCIY
jgi:hypothetical protein